MNVSMEKQYDIIIVGAGLAGMTMALALAQAKLKVCLIEAKPNYTLNEEDLSALDKRTDLRTLALSYTSCQILQALKCWDFLHQTASPIKMVHISELGRFAKARIKASDYKLPALGYVIPIEQLQFVFQRQLELYSESIEVLRPAFVTQIASKERDNLLTIEYENSQHQVAAPIIIAADGQHSSLAKLLNIKTEIFDYQQSAVLGTIGISNPHEYIAYERFLPNGALALLPIGLNQYAFVLTLKNAEAEKWLNMSDEQLLKELHNIFGYRLGNFTWLGKRQTYPLKFYRNTESVKQGVFFVGNSSQTLHPIAAQGFNLGLRDVATLAELLITSYTENPNLYLNIEKLSSEYQRLRNQDVHFIQNFTHSLTWLFSHSFYPISLLRNLGLILFDQTPSLKRFLAKNLMGYTKNMPALSLGLPVTELTK